MGTGDNSGKYKYTDSNGTVYWGSTPYGYRLPNGGNATLQYQAPVTTS